MRASVVFTPRCWAVRRRDVRTCWVCAPRVVRFPPPHILRVTTVGRSACSARQLVASSVWSKGKLKTASKTQQLRETRLMRGVDEVAVGCPAVALQDTGVVGAEHPRRLRKAPPVLDGVDRGGRRREGPEPGIATGDFPAGFIGRDDRTAADGGAQRLVGRLRLTRGAMDGLHQAAARDRETEAVAEQVDDATEGEATLFVQDHRQGHGVRAELPGAGAQRVGRLQRMTALHAPIALSARADRHATFMDEGALHREIFLVLRDDTAPNHPAAAVRTRRRQRRVMRRVDVRRRRAMGLATIPSARLTTGALGLCLGQAARERRGLAVRAAARHLELLFQPPVLAPQTIAFDLGALQILPKSLWPPLAGSRGTGMPQKSLPSRNMCGRDRLSF